MIPGSGIPVQQWVREVVVETKEPPPVDLIVRVGQDCRSLDSYLLKTRSNRESRGWRWRSSLLSSTTRIHERESVCVTAALNGTGIPTVLPVGVPCLGYFGGNPALSRRLRGCPKSPESSAIVCRLVVAVVAGLPFAWLAVLGT